MRATPIKPAAHWTTPPGLITCSLHSPGSFDPGLLTGNPSGVQRLAMKLLLPFLLALTACSPSKPRADLVFVQSAEPETIDPALVTDQVSMRIEQSLFEGLCRVNAQGRPEPGCAERWDMSEDKKHYTFHLREAARWSDGTPVTANDFVQSWHRALEPETGAEYASQLYLIKNAKEYNEGTLKDFNQVGVHAIDDRTLSVDLQNPTPYFIDMAAFDTLAPVPLGLIVKHGSRWIRPGNLLGNGPYLLDEWRLDDHIRLKKNPLYWDAANVKMATVEVLPITDANTALNYFMTGEADLMMDKGMVPPSLTTTLKKQDWFHTGPFLGTWFIRINVTKPPFTDPRVRRALALAVDKKLIVDKITQLGEQPAQSLTPPGAGSNYQPPPGLEFNPQAARELLAQAGFPGGKGFPRIEYLYLPLGVEKNIAIELQAMWKQHLGIEVGLTKQEQKIWLASLRELRYDMCRSSWVGDYNDPNTFLEMFTTGNGNNRTGWESKEYDQGIAAAAAEADVSKRLGIFQGLEKQLISDAAPIIPVYFYVGVQFYHGDKLAGAQANLIDNHPFRCMSWR